VLILHAGRLLVHEGVEELRARGVSVTGPAAAVDGFVSGLTVIGEQQLGPTRSVMVYGRLDEDRRGAARDRGLDLGPVALQDLFIQLTGGSR
jgi:ABC-2 type transport system ATP-binding protein